MLFPLTCPPDIPLWMVAVGMSFGIVIGKEIFGGTGMNILNPALTARVFVFFAFPADISGDLVWVAHDPGTVVDGFSGATALSIAATSPGTVPVVQTLNNFAYSDFSLWNLFFGLVPGSIGETSALMCLIGAVILIVTGVGSWQIMLSVVVGALVTSWGLNFAASEGLPGFLNLPPVYQLVMGGFMFGTVYMATDPVSATATNTGKYIYGFLIGVMCIIIRIWNPAYPEGMMLAILFLNIFAPLIDHYVVQANINRRMKRATAQ
jgi:Na+-transporting NADH:ubiquinone oxidoreductase subunit B